MPTYRRAIRIASFKLPVRLTAARNSNGVKAATGNANRILATPRRLSASSSLMTSATTDASVSLTLPVPPSINHQYATVNGRRLLSSTGRAYKAQVGQLVWLALVNSPHRAVLLSQFQFASLALSIRFYFTSALRRDVDGGLKIAQDALCEGLGVNDNRIVETHLYKHVDKANPRIEVSLKTTAPS
jgi:crossover junction endodeoxyribonuclease RusA